MLLVSPQLTPHAGGEGRNQGTGDQEGGHVEQVQEDLVPLRESRPEVLIA